MRIVLDDFETSLRADSVGEALDAAARTVGESGRLIVEVEVDGAAWSEEDLADAALLSRGATELRLLTAHPGELVRDLLVHACDAIGDAARLQREAATDLQSGRTADAMRSLLEALALWGSVQTAVSRGLELDVVPRAEIPALGIDLDGAIAALDARLRTLRDCMHRQDVASIADVLLYEFPAASTSLSGALAALAAEIGRRSAPCPNA